MSSTLETVFTAYLRQVTASTEPTLTILSDLTERDIHRAAQLVLASIEKTDPTDLFEKL